MELEHSARETGTQCHGDPVAICMIQWQLFPSPEPVTCRFHDELHGAFGQVIMRTSTLPCGKKLHKSRSLYVHIDFLGNIFDI